MSGNKSPRNEKFEMEIDILCIKSIQLIQYKFFLKTMLSIKMKMNRYQFLKNTQNQREEKFGDLGYIN